MKHFFLKRLGSFFFASLMIGSFISCNIDKDIESISKQNFTVLNGQISDANKTFFSSPEWEDYSAKLALLDKGLMDLNMGSNSTELEFKSYVIEHLGETGFSTSQEFENSFENVRNAYTSLESKSVESYAFLEEYQENERALIISQIVDQAFTSNLYGIDNFHIFESQSTTTNGGNDCMDCLNDAEYCRRDANEAYAITFGGAGASWVVNPIVGLFGGITAALHHRRMIKGCVRNLHNCWSRNDCGK